MSTSVEQFEDIDLEDVHTDELAFTTKLHGGEHRNSYRPVQVNENLNARNATSIFKPLILILTKLKNALLMIPALFIFCIISFVAYCTLILALPYRIQSCSENGNIAFGVFSIIIGIIFGLTALITLTSFVRCVFTSSSVIDNPPTISSSKVNSETCRSCQKCSELKPQRAHHCSICGTCTLKMDHHCPWVSNCVGYQNYKYFCLFIWFATLSCHLSSTICLNQLYGLFAGRSGHYKGYSGLHSSWMMINSLLTLAFGVTLTCFSLFHAVLVFKGSTTIEFGGDDYEPFNFGWKKNFHSIFGENCLFWFLPIPTMQGDGYEYCYNDNDELLNDNVYHRNSDDDSLINHDEINEEEEHVYNINSNDDNISDFSTDLTS